DLDGDLHLADGEGASDAEARQLEGPRVVVLVREARGLILAGDRVAADDVLSDRLGQRGRAAAHLRRRGRSARACEGVTGQHLGAQAPDGRREESETQENDSPTRDRIHAGLPYDNAFGTVLQFYASASGRAAGRLAGPDPAINILPACVPRTI